MKNTKIYIRISGKIITHPTIRIGLHENASPMAKVAVTSAVFGNTKENHAIVKIIRPGPIVDKCAKLAIMKKKIASLNGGRIIVSSELGAGGQVVNLPP